MVAGAKRVAMANFIVNRLVDGDDDAVAEMFQTPSTESLDSYVDISLDADFSYELPSVHTYVVLFHADSQISLSVREKLTKWNEDHDVKIIRYQMLADACATKVSGTPCRLAVANANLRIDGDGVNTGGVTTVLNTFSMDSTKTPADMMVGDELLRQVKYHQDHPTRIYDEINIGKTYGGCVLIQFTGVVDEDEFASFMMSEGDGLPGYTVPSTESGGGDGRVFVGFMKDETETDFQNIIDAKYTVSVNGSCVMKFDGES